jgi:hypothetical protein
VTKTPKTDVNCEACGRKVGSKVGTQVILGVTCDNPICEYQGPAPLNSERDGRVLAGALAGIPVSHMALYEGVSRQRIYQIIDTWKQGV